MESQSSKGFTEVKQEYLKFLNVYSKAHRELELAELHTEIIARIYALGWVLNMDDDSIKFDIEMSGKMF